MLSAWLSLGMYARLHLKTEGRTNGENEPIQWTVSYFTQIKAGYAP